MSCIDDLCDWLMEEIFIKLHRSDRLICKEVNKRWYKILMKSYLFKKDRHIFLYTNEIQANEAPMTVLMKALILYDNFTIVNNCMENNSDLLSFFQHVGAGIEELNYSGEMDCEYFATMLSLKFLTLDTGLYEVAKLFCSIKEKYANFAFKHLKQLQVGYLSYFDQALDNIPEDCRIIVTDASIFYDYEIEKCFSVMPVAKINRIRVPDAPDDYRTMEFFEQLFKIDNLVCDELSIEFKSKPDKLDPYLILTALQSTYENLMELTLLCDCLPSYFGIDLPKLTSLTLKCAVTTLKPIEQFQNLKNLVLFLKVNECEDGHESIIMPTLKSLKICMFTFCDECVNALANSFKNLEEFTFKTYQQLTWDQCRKLIDNWKNLKTVTLDIEAPTSNIDGWDSLIQFEPKEHVSAFNIKKVTNLQTKVIEKLSNSFPNLEQLSLETEYSIPSLFYCVKLVFTTFTKIKSFSFIFDKDQPTEDLKNFCDYLESIGFPVKDREMKCVDHDQYERLITFTIDRKKKISKMNKKKDSIGWDLDMDDKIAAMIDKNFYKNPDEMYDHLCDTTSTFASSTYDGLSDIDDDGFFNFYN